MGAPPGSHELDEVDDLDTETFFFGTDPDRSRAGGRA